MTTKSELIEAMSKRQKHLAHQDVELGVKEILEHISLSLSKGERIEIDAESNFLTTLRRPQLVIKGSTSN